MDSSLRCGLALRNPGHIEFSSCLYLYFPFVSIRTIRFAALRAFLASLLSSVVSFCHSPFISSSSSIPRHCSAALFPFHAIAHTSSYNISLLESWSLCIVRTDIPQIHLHWSVVGHHFVDKDFQLFHNFVEFPRFHQDLSIDVLRQISLTANDFCASSITLNWCSYSATFNDHSVSLSFSSFASLHLLGVASMGLGRVNINQRLPRHEPVTWLHVSDLQNCGPCCTFRHVDQCHCQLIVQFYILVVYSVTTVSPNCVLWIPAMQRSQARILQAVCCPTSSSDRVALRPSIAVDYPLHRSVSCSCSQ